MRLYSSAVMLCWASNIRGLIYRFGDKCGRGHGHHDCLIVARDSYSRGRGKRGRTPSTSGEVLYLWWQLEAVQSLPGACWVDSAPQRTAVRLPGSRFPSSRMAEPAGASGSKPFIHLRIAAHQAAQLPITIYLPATCRFIPRKETHHSARNLTTRRHPARTGPMASKNRQWQTMETSLSFPD